MSQSARTRLLTAGVLAAVFGTGVLLGLVVDSDLGAAPTPEEVVVATPEDESEDRPRERRYLYHEVGPNEIQLARIDSIVKEHRARRNALDEELNTEFQTRYRPILLETREAIKSVLSPDQAAEYQRLLDDYDASRQAERENGDERD